MQKQKYNSLIRGYPLKHKNNTKISRIKDGKQNEHGRIKQINIRGKINNTTNG